MQTYEEHILHALIVTDLQKAVKLLKWCRDGYAWPLEVHAALTADIAGMEYTLKEAGL